MFGGEDKLPESVKTAMRMEDYNQGRPLTARRIIAVRDAILQAADKVDAETIDQPKAEALVEDAIKNFNCEMSDNKLGTMMLGRRLHEKAVELVRTHGKGLTDTCQRIPANYVVTAMHSENRNGEERLENKPPALADYLRNVRDFKPGEDYRLSELDDQMKKYLQDVIADARQKKTEGTQGDSGLSATLEEKIANPEHRRIIGAVMNRNLRDAIVSIHIRDALKPTTNFPALNLSEVKGAELTLTVPKNDPSFKTQCPVGARRAQVHPERGRLQGQALVPRAREHEFQVQQPLREERIGQILHGQGG